MFVICGLILSLLCPVKNELSLINPISNRAEILDVNTDLPKMGTWWKAPKGVKEMTIYVTTKNTQTVLFWLVPTGTQTWGERELMGYDKDGSDGWSLTWKFDNRMLHDHIHIQALGEETLSNSIINVESTFP